MSEELIELLAKKCNLMISDLRRPENYIRILPAVMEVAPNCFSVEDWSKSISYIFECDINFVKPEDAKVYCMKELLRIIEQSSSVI